MNKFREVNSCNSDYAKDFHASQIKQSWKYHAQKGKNYEGKRVDCAAWRAGS